MFAENKNDLNRIKSKTYRTHPIVIIVELWCLVLRNVDDIYVGISRFLTFYPHLL